MESDLDEYKRLLRDLDGLEARHGIDSPTYRDAYDMLDAAWMRMTGVERREARRYAAGLNEAEESRGQGE
jgi:hypothetical protein